MENKWIVLIGILIFLAFIILYWKLTNNYGKKEYDKKMWNHWPTRLSYWQGAILYSSGFTVLILFLLKWSNVLNF